MKAGQRIPRRKCRRETSAARRLLHLIHLRELTVIIDDHLPRDCRMQSPLILVVLDSLIS